LETLCPALRPWLDRTTEVSAYLWEKGWAERNAGNLSVDVTAVVADACASLPAGEVRPLDEAYPSLAGRYFLVTGSGHRFRDLAKDPEQNSCILRLAADGRAFARLWGGFDSPQFRPTSEFPAHLRVHEFLRRHDRPEIVVLHTHPNELIAVTHLPEYRDEATINRALWSIHPEVKVTVPRGVGLAPYMLPGSEKLARATVEAFGRNHPVVLWQWHGVVAVGREVMEAFDLIDTLNKAAQLVLLCRMAGHRPEGLSAEHLAEMVRTFKLPE
jgi:rhamnulose-1-phosphate aldolase